MELKKDTNYHGFVVKEDRWIEAIHSHIYLMEHEKSGAKALYFKNKDKNKVFSITFKTPPTDHTGVAHILEHSVLCGSKKYTAKDPFNELAKGSLNTYLNAMTFSDKTMYPVASCNEEDYHNLMDVYLDAVFFPNIYDKKEIFMQEGWRYFFNDEGNLDITGVVYNEMHGALADPESRLDMEIAKNFYGETTYGFESGGDPEYIPELTYEDFLNFHKTKYHPSNSYVFIYGDLDIERALEHVDTDYLSKFDKIEVDETVKIVAKKPEKFITEATYPAQSEDEDEKGYLTYTYNMGTSIELEKSLTMQILSYCLLESNASPIKNELLNAGICHEVEGWLESSNYEVIFTIVAKNAETSRVKEFESIVKNTMKDIVENGLDKDLVRSCLKRIEFLIKEEDYGSTPKGLAYNIRCMRTWLHGESPFINFYQMDALNKLKDASFSWEDFINKMFVENELCSIVVFTPEEGKEKIQEENYRKALADKQKNMSEEEKQQILDDIKALDIFQTTEETEEVLNQIPFLKLDQVSKTPTFIDYTVDNVACDSEAKRVYAPIENSDIIYMKLQFNLQNIPDELLPYCGLLTEVFGKLDTELYDYEKLPLISNEVVGSLIINTEAYSKSKDDYFASLTLKTKFLIEDFEDAKKLFEQILFNTNFEKLDNLKKILQSAKVSNENYLMSAPHLLAIATSAKYQSKMGYVQENISGITYIHNLADICKEIENDHEAIINNLKEVSKRLLCKENFSIAFACNKDLEKDIDDYMKEMYDKLPKSEYKNATLKELEDGKSTAFTSPMQVQYNILASNYSENYGKYVGSMEVLRTILNLEYLWNQVRVQGGAYGAGCSFKRTGDAYFYSYRDPNIENTYDIYKKLCEEIENFSVSEKEMTKYILGTINNFDQPKTNADIFAESVSMAYTDMSREEIQSQRDAILSCDVETIRSFADMLESVGKSNNYTTVGNTQKIEENSGYFQQVKNLIP